MYDEGKQRFDHHQRGFEEVFGYGFVTKLSSAGLVYKWVLNFLRHLFCGSVLVALAGVGLFWGGACNIDGLVQALRPRDYREQASARA